MNQNPASEPPTEDFTLTPSDCNVYENIQGTGWGPNPAQATTAATTECDAVFKALHVRCPDPECPVARKEKSVGKPRPNKITISLPFLHTITITIGWVCEYEIIYGCFPRTQGEPA